MKPIIEFKDYTFKYRSQVDPTLYNINLAVYPGEKVLIVGPSGSGKTTLLNCISTIDTATDGHIYLDGKDILEIREKDIARFRRESLGFIFQDFNLIPSLNVWENIVLPLGLDNRKVKPREVEDILKKIGLQDKKDAMPSALSGGQKQRLCIARALLKKPKILILDDSTSAVDTKTDAMIRSGFKEFIPETTKIIIAQRISSVQDADRIIVINDGLVEKSGKGEDVIPELLYKSSMCQKLSRD